jgi:hypothetical protein
VQQHVPSPAVYPTVSCNFVCQTPQLTNFVAFLHLTMPIIPSSTIGISRLISDKSVVQSLTGTALCKKTLAFDKNRHLVKKFDETDNKLVTLNSESTNDNAYHKKESSLRLKGHLPYGTVPNCSLTL